MNNFYNRHNQHNDLPHNDHNHYNCLPHNDHNHYNHYNCLPHNLIKKNKSMHAVFYILRRISTFPRLFHTFFTIFDHHLTNISPTSHAHTGQTYDQTI